MSKKILVIALVAFITMIASVSVARANHESLDVCCAWNSELADGDLTYSISGGTDLAQGTVRTAVQAWDAELDDLTLTETSDNKPNIKIRLKGGGGVTAGLALRHFDGVLIKSVNLSISSKAFGVANEQPIIEQIVLHEFAHALGTGHANFPDLMTPVLGAVNTISTCDVDGVLAASAWYFDNPDSPGTPAAPTVSEVDCSSGGAAPADDVGLTAITGPDTAARGEMVIISFTVFNHGNNSATFDLLGSESPDGGSVSALGVVLASGESGDFALTGFPDNETSLGDHTWTFTHSLSDDDSSNDLVSHTVTITEPSEEESDCPPRSRAPQCQ